jgi:hypothetical protein
MMLDTVPIFKVGDPCPDGYVARIEWNKVHEKAGLRQIRCGSCGLWHWPHEMSEKIKTSIVLVERIIKRRRSFAHEARSFQQCLACEKKPTTTP